MSVLHSVSIAIEAGECVALTGPSGSGKTTLMNIMGLLDAPSSGRLWIAGEDAARGRSHRMAQIRNGVIGFVFQSFHLLPHLSALDNVAMPLIYRGLAKRERRALAAGQLERLGLGSLTHRRPAELSGGQRQRVAVARALVGGPKLLLADEPTGNLDSASARDVMALFFSISRELGITAVVVTHDEALARQCARRVVMQDGVLVEDARMASVEQGRRRGA